MIKTVRQAIGHMVNRDKIAKEILDGQEKPATQLFAKNVKTLISICQHVSMTLKKQNHY